MLNKRIIFLLVGALLITNICYAGYMKLLTQEQIQKYCIGVRLKIDNDLHYFSYFSVVEMSDEKGLVLKYGKNKDKTVVYPKSEILNWDEARERYHNLVITLGGTR